MTQLESIVTSVKRVISDRLESAALIRNLARNAFATPLELLGLVIPMAANGTKDMSLDIVFVNQATRAHHAQSVPKVTMIIPNAPRVHVVWLGHSMENVMAIACARRMSKESVATNANPDTMLSTKLTRKAA